jgi:hypothetical protein
MLATSMVFSKVEKKGDVMAVTMEYTLVFVMVGKWEILMAALKAASWVDVMAVTMEYTLVVELVDKWEILKAALKAVLPAF